MCEFYDLPAIRGAIEAERARSAAVHLAEVTGDTMRATCWQTVRMPPPLKRGDKVAVYSTGKEHIAWYLTEGGKPVVFIGGRKTVLEPGQYGRVGA